MKLTSITRHLLRMAVLGFFGIVAGTVVANPADMPIKPSGSVPLKLYVFDCGKIRVRDMSLFDPTLPKGVSKELANACYLIKHPSGMLFWDAGLSDSLVTTKGGVDVYDRAINLSVTHPLREQLSAIGVAPDTIDYIGSSHLHSDHTGNLAYFKAATWLLQQAEYEAAFSDKASQYGFNPADYNGLKSGKTVKIKGNYDVFGDGSVVMIAAPGHSPGHQALFIDLPVTGPVILSGDLYHCIENREKYAIPIWNNRRESIYSFVKVDKLLKQTGAALWIQHDKGQFDRLKKAPAYYE